MAAISQRSNRVLSSHDALDDYVAVLTFHDTKIIIDVDHKIIAELSSPVSLPFLSLRVH